jgi:multimeric flavodoxin WrbA
MNLKTFVLCGSPRRDGNSAILAQEVKRGLEEAGHEVALEYVGDVLGGFLRDCRTCRNSAGECSIEDGFGAAFLDRMLPATGFIVATPVYWYGMSGLAKTFFDRMFCYVAASHPKSESVVSALLGKRIGLVLSSEETFPTVASGLVHQVQEYARYTRSTFAGVVHGYGNARGDVRRDPSAPVADALEFGRRFYDLHATDYQIDTPRSGRVWPL